MDEAMVEQVNSILRTIGSTKARGPNKMPPESVKMSTNIIQTRAIN